MHVERCDLCFGSAAKAALTVPDVPDGAKEQPATKAGWSVEDLLRSGLSEDACHAVAKSLADNGGPWVLAVLHENVCNKHRFTKPVDGKTLVADLQLKHVS